MRNNYLLQILFCLLIIQSLQLHAQTTIVTVQGSGKVYVQSNANAYVHGGLLFQNGSLLSNTGTVTVKEIGASGASNWTDQTATPYFHGSGTVIFNGVGGHTATSPNTFGKIHVNASGHLTHGSDLNTNNLLLDNGRVNTTSSYKMIVLTTPELASDNPPLSQTPVIGCFILSNQLIFSIVHIPFFGFQNLSVMSDFRFSPVFA